MSFFFLGAATTIAWDSIYMSVAYFEQFLGKKVLSVLSLFYSLPLFVAMIICLGLKTQLSIGTMALLIKLCSAYMLGLCVLIPVIVWMGLGMSAVTLCLLVTVCGVSTGVMQSMVASVSGIFSQFSLESGASGAALKGTGGAILIPMAVQISFIPVALKGVSTINASVMVVFPLACCILAASYAALRVLSGSVTWSLAARDLQGAMTCMGENHNPADCTLGRAPSFSQQRFLLVKWCAVGQVVSLTVTAFALVLTPHIAPCRSDSAAFWQQYLATILIATHTVANFGGRAAVGGGRSMRPPSMPLLVSLVLGRLLFIPCIVGYVRGDMRWLLPRDPWNLGITATYFLMSFSGGVAAMLLSMKAQSLCDHSHRVPCPIVSQITWIAIQLGGLVGVATSYIKVG